MPEPLDFKYGMPVGTSTLIPIDRFKREDRDKSCQQCVNGRKGSLIKNLHGNNHKVPIMCLCVPYWVKKDEAGTEVVKFKGRQEVWPNGKRSDADIQSELLRKQVAMEAVTRRDNLRDSISIGAGKTKYNIAPVTVAELKAAGLSPSDLDSATTPMTNSQRKSVVTGKISKPSEEISVSSEDAKISI